MKLILTKVAVVSLGCSKNLVDTENMLGIIKKGGCEIIIDEADADVIIINTCCFIDDAKQESIDAILEAARQKEEGNCKTLIVTGCLAQRYKDEVIKEMPEVDYVIGVGHISDILSAISGTGQSVMCEKPYSHPISERIYQTPEYSAYLKIADGCDNRCTYCIIPYIRGGFNSLPIEVLVKEARQLATRGAKELTLIAQDTTSYGIDLYPQPKLVPLLKELCTIDGIEWIRLHYCYPERITDELIDTVASEEKICKYFDIPIQHCNDDILRKMGRKTSKAHIEDIISKIRSKIPGVTLRTTLITGFPTETDEQYLEMLEFIERIKFERLGIFTYSREEGTPAAKMKGQLDEEIKLRRLEMLMLCQANIAQELSEGKIGSKIKVLTEGYDALIKQYYGRSEADSADIDGKVFFTSNKAARQGTFAEVKINKAMDYDLFGKAEF
jgi:ribosomal protein S12 methylthiotransferase